MPVSNTMVWCDDGGDHGALTGASGTAANGGMYSGVNLGTGGSAQYDNTTSLGGGHTGSMKVVTGTAGATNLTVSNAFTSAAKLTGRLGAYFKMSALPSTSTCQLMGGYTSATTGFCIFVGITTTGKLSLLTGASGTTVLGTGTTTVSVTSPFRLTMVWNITSTTVFTLKIFLNGNLELTVSSGTLATQNSNLLGFGALSVYPGNNISIWWSDAACDELGNLGTDFGSDCRVTNKKPAALGDLNQWPTLTGGAAGGRWNYVNDSPVNTATTISTSVSGVLTERFTLQAANVGSVDISAATVFGGVTWAYWKASTTVGTCTLYGPNNVAFVMNNATTFALSYAAWSLSSYPSSNNVCGMASSSSNLTTMSEVGVMVAYIPAAAAAFSSRRMMMGVGL